MRLLLDMHVLAWWALGNERLSRRGRDLIDRDATAIGVSVATLWEAAIKNNLRRADPIGLTVTQLLALIDEVGLILVAIEARHAIAVERLPDVHGDPFDRLLVATAIADRWQLLTHDETLAAYGDHVMVI